MKCLRLLHINSALLLNLLYFFANHAGQSLTFEVKSTTERRIVNCSEGIDITQAVVVEAVRFLKLQVEGLLIVIVKAVVYKRWHGLKVLLWLSVTFAVIHDGIQVLLNVLGPVTILAVATDESVRTA